MNGAWSRFWYSPEPPFNIAVARMILALNALWIVLSRPDWPEQFDFPAAFWLAVEPELWLRFGFTGSSLVERILFIVLHASLIAAAGGLFPRTASFISGILLVHFAPLETIFWSPNPYLRGLTVPALGLLVLSFSPCGSVSLRSFGTISDQRCRWPLKLIQVFFCQIYLFAAWSKIYKTGASWVTGENVRGWMIALDQTMGWAPLDMPVDRVVHYPLLMTAMAIGGFLFDLLFSLVLFIPRARWIFIPAAVLFHIGNAALFYIFFHNLPLLLLFIDWQGIFSTRRMRP